MKKLILCLCLLAPTIAHADLRPAPRVTFCTPGTTTDESQKGLVPDTARLPAKCDGECLKAAERICKKQYDKNNVKITGDMGSAPATGALGAVSWQGAIVTGLGEFIADRAKAEVATWFEDLVRDKLCALETGQQQWFPTTCKLLRDDMGTGQQLASALLVESVGSDLQPFMKGLATYINDKDPSKRLGFVIETIPMLVVLGDDLSKGRSPLEVLKDAGRNESFLDSCRSNADKTSLSGPCLIVFAGISVDFYGDVIKSGVPADLDELRELALKLLVEDEYRKAVCAAFDPKDCVLPNAVASFVDATVITDADTLDKWLRVIRDAYEINEYVQGLSPRSTSDEAREQLAQIIELVDRLWTDLGTAVWGSAPPTNFKLVHDVLVASSAIARAEYRTLLLHLVEAARDSGVELPDWAARLMPLVIDLVEAKDSAAVSAAIERAAAPIGSWKLKRQKPLISVSALVGGMVGGERVFVSSLGMQAIDRVSPAAGLIAPLGLHFSAPWNETWSIGALVSVLDLGQVTWSRLDATKNSDTEAGVKAQPEPTFAKVLSPGLYLTVGAGHTPFTFGIGASLAPYLRDYTYTDAGEPVDRSLTVLRFGAFAAVDVTLFPF